MQKIANNPEVKECIIMPVHEGIELSCMGMFTSDTEQISSVLLGSSVIFF